MREWVITPLIGAVIGYLTNWLAIKMLFRPHTEKRVFGIRLPFTPGLIPKERRQLAKKLGETLSGKVLTEEVLAEAINGDSLSAGLEGLADGLLAKAAAEERTLNELLGSPGAALARLEEPTARALPRVSAYIRELADRQPELDGALRKLTVNVAKEQFGGLVGLFVNYDRVYDNLKNSLCYYLDDPTSDLPARAGESINRFLTADIGEARVMDLYAKLPEGVINGAKPALVKAARLALEKGGAYVARSIDVSKALEDKVNSFEIREAEEIILNVVSRELRLITLLGGLLGFVIGFLPAVINLIGK